MKSTSAAKTDRISLPLAQVWKWSESLDNIFFSRNSIDNKAIENWLLFERPKIIRTIYTRTNSCIAAARPIYTYMRRIAFVHLTLDTQSLYRYRLHLRIYL